MLKTNNAPLVVIVLIICVLHNFAQNNNTTSPYPYGYGRTSAMGGASLESRYSIQINSVNRASYNSIDNLFFLFELGVDANSNSIRSYLSRIKYSAAGTYHNNSYLKLNNQENKMFGISFGAGIPVPKTKSTANFVLEFGKRETMNNDLARNNYTKIKHIS